MTTTTILLVSPFALALWALLGALAACPLERRIKSIVEEDPGVEPALWSAVCVLGPLLLVAVGLWFGARGLFVLARSWAALWRLLRPRPSEVPTARIVNRSER
jgi:hypothetical protein